MLKSQEEIMANIEADRMRLKSIRDNETAKAEAEQSEKA